MNDSSNSLIKCRYCGGDLSELSQLGCENHIQLCPSRSLTVEEVPSSSRIPPTFLEYLGMSQIKKKDEESKETAEEKLVYEIKVKQPILYIDEMRGASQAGQPIKLLYSEGRLILGSVVKGRPVEIRISG